MVAQTLVRHLISVESLTVVVVHLVVRSIGRACSFLSNELRGGKEGALPVMRAQQRGL